MFKENSHSYRIMALIGMTGECSEKALSILIPHEPYRNKVISRLITKKAITKHQKNNLMGFRLTRNSKKMLLEIAEERFGFFLQDGADYTMRRSSVSYRLRQHRISETLAMMEQAKFIIHRDNKNDIFEETPTHTDKIMDSVFYLSKEIKSQKDLTRKIISSKITGLLLSENSAWLCYQSSQELFWWSDNIERRTETLIWLMLKDAGIYFDECDALLFGDSMKQAKAHLANRLMTDYLQRTSFRRFCFIQMDENGIMLLKLLDNKPLYNNFFQILSEDLTPSPNTYIIQDGLNAEGRPVLICIDCDLKRLVIFRNQLYFSNNHGEVICFDFQENAIKEFCGKNISISTVDSKKVWEAFFSE